MREVRYRWRVQKARLARAPTPKARAAVQDRRKPQKGSPRIPRTTMAPVTRRRWSSPSSLAPLIGALPVLQTLQLLRIPLPHAPVHLVELPEGRDDPPDQAHPLAHGWMPEPAADPAAQEETQSDADGKGQAHGHEVSPERPLPGVSILPAALEDHWSSPKGKARVAPRLTVYAVASHPGDLRSPIHQPRAESRGNQDQDAGQGHDKDRGGAHGRGGFAIGLAEVHLAHHAQIVVGTHSAGEQCDRREDDEALLDGQLEEVE